MLSRAHRFHGHNSLNQTYQRGKTIRSGTLTLKYVQNQRRSTFRVAVVVSKKVSKSAVVRNRIRRRIYEAVRLQTGATDQPLDLVFLAYSADIAVMPAAQLQKAIANLLRQTNSVLH